MSGTLERPTFAGCGDMVYLVLIESLTGQLYSSSVYLIENELNDRAWHKTTTTFKIMGSQVSLGRSNFLKNSFELKISWKFVI